MKKVITISGFSSHQVHRDYEYNSASHKSILHPVCKLWVEKAIPCRMSTNEKSIGPDGSFCRAFLCAFLRRRRRDGRCKKVCRTQVLEMDVPLLQAVRRPDQERNAAGPQRSGDPKSSAVSAGGRTAKKRNALISNGLRKIVMMMRNKSRLIYPNRRDITDIWVVGIWAWMT